MSTDDIPRNPHPTLSQPWTFSDYAGAAHSEPFVAMEFAGCGADEKSRESAMAQTHDNLIAHYPVRLGPVEWNFYAGSEAVEKLRLAGIADDRGLVAWLTSQPDTELLIASVLVPADGARLPERLTADDVLRRMA